MREDIAFTNIMKLIQQYPYASEEEYNKGISQCQELEKEVERECSNLQFKLEDLKNNASKMKEENCGDILPALQYLSQFTYAKDPRFCGKDVKVNYLTGVLLFTSTANDYLKMRIEERKYSQEGKK